MTTGKERKTDFIVVGSGIAAMRAAVDLAQHGQVLILNKGDLFKPTAHYQLGGIAVALAEDDEVPLHLHDTLQAGDGLCREEAVKVLVEEGPNLINELIEWGVRFRHNGTKLAFNSVGIHSRSRVLHAHGDSTGGEMRRVLLDRAKTLSSIHLHPHAFVAEILIDGGRAAGVTFIDENSGDLRTVHAKAILLATGGMCQVFHETTNPPFACGDGVAMAYRAGALLSDMEFIQFHPTVLYMKNAPRYVLSEALRGEGAQLRNIDLERFMPRYHEAAELAPRDVVSRAMVMEMTKSGSDFTYLDLTALSAERITKRFPQIYSRFMDSNIDITTDLIPVRPAAHYAMGGIATDLHGATSLPGLYAAGEVAATGVHGANRLASNSLLEDLVYGARAAGAMVSPRAALLPSPSKDKTAASPGTNVAKSGSPLRGMELEKATDEVRCLLSRNVGIIREGKGLKKSVARLDEILSKRVEGTDRKQFENWNILEAARLIAKSALAREESRGAHYRSDFPLKSTANPPKHSFLTKNSPVFFE